MVDSIQLQKPTTISYAKNLADTKVQQELLYIMQHINRENNKAPFFLKGVVSRKVTCKKKGGKKLRPKIPLSADIRAYA